jgi:hypothetical protein
VIVKKSSTAILSISMAAGLVMAAIPGMAIADDGTSDDALSTFRSVAPDYVANSVAPETALSTSSDNAVATVSDEAITIKSDSGTLSLVAPQETSGVQYQPVLMDDGSALIAIVIDSPAAGDVFDFQALTSDDSRAKVLEDGSVLFTATDGSFKGGLATPWARDSKGNDIPTRFEVTDANTVRQHVDLSNVPADAYPVVADPWAGHDLVAAAWVTNQGGSDYVVNAVPTSWGEFYRGIDTHYAHVAELKAKLGSLAYKVTATIDNQFICHVNYGWLGGGATYNMESWRPNIHWTIQGNPVTKCNP